MVVLMADTPGYAYGIFGLFVLGVAVTVGISYLSSTPCSRCNRRVQKKSAIRYTENEEPSGPAAAWHDVFASDSSEPLFCSKKCRDLYQDELSIDCGWCDKPFLWKNRVPIEGERRVVCSLRCRTDFEAANGVKEERKRIIREDQSD